jgi:hypothetical protein
MSVGKWVGTGEIDISTWYPRLRFALALALVFALTLAIGSPSPALAQQMVPSTDASDAEQGGGDPPARAGRLSYIEGAVSLQPAGVDDWNAAPLNQPLTTGDALWTDSGSRAEADLGPAIVRLDERTSVALLDLSDRAIQLRVDGGSVEISVSDTTAVDALEIDAPNAAMLLLRPGEYRLSVDNSGTTSIAVRAGQVSVQSGDQQNMTLLTGQRGVYGAKGSFAVAQAGAPDDFDRWCQQRQSHLLEDQAVAQYVSSDAVGYEDLNDYGQWEQTPDYGEVWMPTQVPDDWVPYSAGHWAWVGRWGWTWIDDAPWGFAPFHYGRWGHVGRRWCWIPSPPHRHAIYAPALVAWVGGPHAGGALALGGGSAVGWVPLGPGEAYVPASHVSSRYFQNVNLSNSSRLSAGYLTSVWNNPAVQNHYVNRDVPGALTVVPQSNFTAGQAVSRHRIDPPPQFQTASLAATAPGIAPERASVVGPLSLSQVRMPPAMVTERAVFSRRQPPSPAPSFARQLPAISANGGRPLDATQLQTLQSPGPVRRFVPSAAQVGHPAAGANQARGIPERPPQFQNAAQAPTTNVFQQRDREIEEQRQAQQRQQQAQEAQIQQRLQQQHLQQQQRPAQPQPQVQEAQPQPAVSPPRPRTDVRRPPPPPTPAEQR